MTLIGTVERVDIGMGAYVLTDAKGRRYTLRGPVPDAVVGKQVRIRGEAVEDMGTGMLGTDGAVAFASETDVTTL